MAEEQTKNTYHQLPDLYKIKAIVGRHGLKVIYDAAYVFGVEKDSRSLPTLKSPKQTFFEKTKERKKFHKRIGINNVISHLQSGHRTGIT